MAAQLNLYFFPAVVTWMNLVANIGQSATGMELFYVLFQFQYSIFPRPIQIGLVDWAEGRIHREMVGADPSEG